jgi:hypothetical protein
MMFRINHGAPYPLFDEGIAKRFRCAFVFGSAFSGEEAHPITRVLHVYEPTARLAWARCGEGNRRRESRHETNEKLGELGRHVMRHLKAKCNVKVLRNIGRGLAPEIEWLRLDALPTRHPAPESTPLAGADPVSAPLELGAVRA